MTIALAPVLHRLAGFTIRRADWSHDRAALEALRRAVFIVEQQVSESLEWDGLDATALHLLAETPTGEPIGTARLLPSGQLGRMAVRADWRGRGVGRALLQALLDLAAAQRLTGLFLHAQVSALGFYRRLGFHPVGAPFDDAGIAHRQMRRAAGRDAVPERGIKTLGTGPAWLDGPAAIRDAQTALAAAARRELLLLTPDLEPACFDQRAFLDAVRALALARCGQQPVRVLCGEPGPALRRGHRLIELARRLPSAIEIKVLPETTGAIAEAPGDRVLIADARGYCLRRAANPTRAEVAGDHGAVARQQRRRFDDLWQQAVPSMGLRRLSL